MQGQDTFHPADDDMHKIIEHEAGMTPEQMRKRLLEQRLGPDPHRIDRAGKPKHDVPWHTETKADAPPPPPIPGMPNTQDIIHPELKDF